MIQEQTRTVFKRNPSLSDLENDLRRERVKLETTYGSQEDRHRIISKIRMLRSSIDMLKGYMQHFQMN